MALNDVLLEKLACPRCKGELEYKDEENRLDCNKCRKSYRVVDDIPVLLIDEAEPIK
jgi:uncharacterized protein YbaR (Trm112 family)